MGYRRGKTLELTISDIAFGGKGLAKVDNFAIFVDKAVTNDRLVARITKKKKNYAEARIVEMLEPSSFRIEAPCKYSGYCGGCKWQFLEYEKQLKYKTKQVRDSLEHIGLIKDVKVLETKPSELVFNYRNKMEFSCSDKRWLMPDELNDKNQKKDFGIGLHVPGTFHKVIDIKRCLIQPETGNDILEDVRQFIIDSEIPAYGLKSHEGFWRFLMLRHSVYYDEWMVNIITSTNKPEIIKSLSDQLTKKYKNIVSVVNNITASRSGISVGESEYVISGSSTIKDRLGEYEFEISPNSFFQTNTRGAVNLYETVKEYAELTGEEVVLDLYSGTGTIPIFVSDMAKKVIGIEIVESAVEDANLNCKRNSVDNCSFILGDIKNILPDLEEKPDVMIIDPPRVGMHKDVVKQVLAVAPEKIVYVSCNPSTLARDLLMMKDFYRVVEVQPVDMFPHTYHIEAVAKLEKI